MSALAIEFPEDVRAAVEGVESFIRREVFPLHEKHDALLSDSSRKYNARGVFSDDAWKVVTELRQMAAEAGFYAMCAPVELGGGGMGHLAYYATWERIFHLCGTKNWLGHHMISHWAKGPSPVIANLTAKAQELYLPGLLSGEHTMCFGLSEPGAGSDAAGVQSTARPDGNGWRLNGGKIWTTNSPLADYMIVFAITDPERAAARKGGISAFIVPTDAPGFTRDKVIKMWGSSGTDECMSYFDDVRLERHQLVGELHKGFATAMLGVGLGRIYNCARSVGLSRWALEMAFDYTKTRKTFGRAISEYQGVTFPLAQSATEIHAARLMSINVAQLQDQGQRASKELAMAKGFAVQAGVRAVDRVIQAHGAIGMTNEMGLTDAFVILRKINVADGTNEILNRLIVKEMLSGNLEL